MTDNHKSKLVVCFWSMIVAVLLGVFGVMSESNAADDTDSKILKSNFDEKTYEEVVNIFTGNTNLSSKQIQFIETRILPQISHKSDFLEIGPGEGYITGKIAKSFSKTTVVEPIKAYRKKYEDLGYITFTKNFQDIDLQNQYDFILCSQMLYYIKRSEWDSFLKNIYNAIKPGGKALIVIQAPADWVEAMLASIKPNCPSSREVENVLKSAGIAYEISFVENSFKYPIRDSFMKVLKVFVTDDCFTPEEFAWLTESEKIHIENKISQYVDSCERPKGNYEMFWQDGYIVLSKDDSQKKKDEL